MRLLVVTQYFWPEDFRINDLVSEFVMRGHDVTVLTGRPNYPSGRVFAEFRKQPGQFSTYEGARILRVFTNAARDGVDAAVVLGSAAPQLGAQRV